MCVCFCGCKRGGGPKVRPNMNSSPGQREHEQGGLFFGEHWKLICFFFLWGCRIFFIIFSNDVLLAHFSVGPAKVQKVGFESLLIRSWMLVVIYDQRCCIFHKVRQRCCSNPPTSIVRAQRKKWNESGENKKLETKKS